MICEVSLKDNRRKLHFPDALLVVNEFFAVTIAVLKATATAPTTTAARVGTGTPSRSGRCSGSSPVGIRPSKPEKSLPRWKRSRGCRLKYL